MDKYIHMYVQVNDNEWNLKMFSRDKAFCVGVHRS